MKDLSDTTVKFFVPLVMKSVGVTSEDTPWYFEGIASTPDLDLMGDVVYPESFDNSIEFFKEHGKIYFDHDYAKKNTEWLQDFGFSKEELLGIFKSPIGKPLEANIVDGGLLIKGVLNKEHPMARIMWNQFLNNNDKTFSEDIGLSIGAKYLGEAIKRYEPDLGKFVTVLPELLLYEVSMTPQPVNPFTSSWSSTLKSLAEAATLENNSNIPQTYEVTPDAVVYDAGTNKLAVSTIIKGDSGDYIINQYIDLQEDVKKAMEEDKKDLKNPDFPAPEEESAETAVVEEAPVEEAPTEEAAPEMDAPTEEAAPADMIDATAMGEEAAPEPAIEAEAMGEEAAPMGDEMAGLDSAMDEAMGGDEAEAGGGVLDSLVEEGVDGQADESQGIMLDKLDTILDSIAALMDKIDGANVEPEIEGSEQPPMMDEATMKSVMAEFVPQDVNVSEQSILDFGNTLKSVLAGFKTDIINEVKESIKSEFSTPEVDVHKSTTVEKKAEIVAPGATVDGSIVDTTKAATADSGIVSEVRKSIGADSASQEDVKAGEVVLKSLIQEYVGIIGSSPAHSSERAQVVGKVGKQLGMSDFEFRNAVRKFEKANRK